MTKEKAKLTQVQADALTTALEIYCNNYVDLIADRIENSLEDFTRPYSELLPIADMSIDLLIRAIYVGFEIEKTPEEIVRDEYNRQGEYYVSSYAAGIREGIFFTLNAFGVHVKGVNDDAPTE